MNHVKEEEFKISKLYVHFISKRVKCLIESWQTFITGSASEACITKTLAGDLVTHHKVGAHSVTVTRFAASTKRVILVETLTKKKNINC